MILLKELKIGPPQNEENALELLSGKITNIEKLKEMRGFRNILVHKYGKIKDNLVYNFALEEREDFRIFIDDVKKLIDIEKDSFFNLPTFNLGEDASENGDKIIYK